MEKTLKVPHNGKEIIFTYPEGYPNFGRNEYVKLGQQIISENMQVPIGEYIASLLHAAYCNNKTKNIKEFENVRNIFEKNWFWVYNICVGGYSKGIYVVDDINAKGNTEKLNLKDLEERLKNGKEISWGGVRISEDKLVRFAPSGSFNIGEVHTKYLENDGLIVSIYGKEGAKKLSEVCERFFNIEKDFDFKITPQISGFGRVNDLKRGQNISSINKGPSEDIWIHCGGGWVDHSHGSAFGILK